MVSLVPLDSYEHTLQGYADENEIANRRVGRDPNAKGVFGSLPMCTPKYERHLANRHHEYEGTMARMLLQIPSGTFEALRNELEDDLSQQIAEVLANDGLNGGIGYIDFLLTQADHNLEEKVQISDSLADGYTAFFFGNNPPIFSYAGTLLNSFQDNWVMQMLRLYQDLGRGTQLARRGMLMHLRYDSMMVAGAMMNLHWRHMAGRETADGFSFNFLVKRITPFLGGLSGPTNLNVVDSMSAADHARVVTLSMKGIESTQTYVQAPPGGGPEGTRTSSSNWVEVDRQGNPL